MTTPVAFAVPGDITTLTGGYIYDRQLRDALVRAGQTVAHVPLPGGFPFPAAADMARAIVQLQALPANQCVIIDGLAFGALPPDAVARIKARIIALVHHPLAYESDLPVAQQQHLLANERENLRHAAQVLVPSPHTKATLVAHYGVPAGRIHVATPGVAQAAAAPAPAPRPLILSVGILHPRKGHDVLIAALGLIAARDWDACIVGRAWQDGHDTRLQAQIDALGLGGRVRLAGQIAQGALGALYAQAHLFALATRYEGYGMVFAEALVHGLPIVACRTGAVPDTVPADAGLLAPVDDPRAFADALGRVPDDRALAARMAAAARVAGRALGTWDDTAAVALRAIAAARVGAV